MIGKPARKHKDIPPFIEIELLEVLAAIGFRVNRRIEAMNVDTVIYQIYSLGIHSEAINKRILNLFVNRYESIE